MHSYVEIFHWEDVILEFFIIFQLFNKKFQLYLSKRYKMFWLTLPSICSVNKSFAWKMSVNYIHNLLESPSSGADISTWLLVSGTIFGVFFGPSNVCFWVSFQEDTSKLLEN